MVTGARTQVRSEANHSGAGFSLLVVDDIEANREGLARRLQRHGYSVTTAEDGAGALDLLAATPFDLVLLDVMMPGINGLEVLQRIRQTLTPIELPVIMATARETSEDIVQALGLGANDYVIKPLDFAVVLARVQTQLALRRSYQENLRLEEHLSERNAELEAANARLHRDLRAAARVQQAYLPRGDVTVAGLDFAWSIAPCEELAGDSLNFRALGDNRAAVYVLDVSGHGVAAALLAVSVARVLATPAELRARTADDVEAPAGNVLIQPAEVLTYLNRVFAWDAAAAQFFTILYGVMDVNTDVFSYASAGQPPAIHVPNAGPSVVLAGEGLPIGVSEDATYEQHAVTLARGERIYLYSDGIPETFDAAGEPFGMSRLLAALEQGRALPLQDSVNQVQEEVRCWAGAPLRDDAALVAFETTARTRS